MKFPPTMAVFVAFVASIILQAPLRSQSIDYGMIAGLVQSPDGTNLVGGSFQLLGVTPSSGFNPVGASLSDLLNTANMLSVSNSITAIDIANPGQFYQPGLLTFWSNGDTIANGTQLYILASTSDTFSLTAPWALVTGSDSSWFSPNPTDPLGMSIIEMSLVGNSIIAAGSSGPGTGAYFGTPSNTNSTGDQSLILVPEPPPPPSPKFTENGSHWGTNFFGFTNGRTSANANAAFVQESTVTNTNGEVSAYIFAFAGEPDPPDQDANLDDTYDLAYTELTNGTALSLNFSGLPRVPQYVYFTGGDLVAYALTTNTNTHSLDLILEASVTAVAASASNPGRANLQSGFGLVVEFDQSRPDYQGTVFQTDVFWEDIGPLLTNQSSKFTPLIGLSVAGEPGENASFTAYLPISLLGSEGITEPFHQATALVQTAAQGIPLPTEREVYDADHGFINFDGTGYAGMLGVTYWNSAWFSNTAWNVGLAAPEPLLLSGATSLTGFNTVRGRASTAQSFSVSAINLTQAVTITPPPGYEVANGAGGAYSSTLTLTPTEGTLASASIFVRLAASAAVGTRSGNLTIASAAAAPLNISLAGNVTIPPPSLIASPSALKNLSAKRGKASKSQRFTVFGSNLTSTVTVRAPAGYQVSRSATKGYASSIKVAPAKTGSLARTTIYVRIAANKKAKVGSRNGKVIISSMGASARSVSLTGKITK